MPVVKGNAFNFVHAQIYRVNSSGIAVGQLDPTSLTNDTTSHAYKMDGPVSASLPQPTYSTVEFRAGGKIQGQATIGVESIGAFDMVVSVYDATVNALIGGSKNDTTTLSAATIGAPNTGKINPNRVGLILTAQFQSRDSATDGQNKYITYILPSCECRSSGPINLTQDGGTNPNPVTLNVTPTMTSKQATGLAFGTNQGLEDNRDYIYWIIADYPYALTAYVQDGTETTYTLGYLPVSSDATGTASNQLTVNGAVTAATSVATSTAVVTLAGAGTAGQIANALYQTIFAPVS